MRISFSIVLGFVVTTGVAQDLSKGILYNKESIERAKIKLIEVWRYSYYLGRPSDEGYLSYRASYEKQGNIQKEEYYSEDGQLTSEEVYDSLGRKVEELGYDTDEKPNSRKVYHYDTTNSLVELEVFGKLGVHKTRGIIEGDHRYVYKYDDKRRKIDEILYVDDRLVSRTISRFNQSNNVTEEIEFKNDGVITSKSKYRYDKSGRLVEQISLDNKSRIVSKNQYRYYVVDGTKKVQVNESIESSGKRTSRWVLASDSVRNYAEWIAYDDKGKVFFKWTQKQYYDKDGYPLKRDDYLMGVGKPPKKELILFKYTHFE